MIHDAFGGQRRGRRRWALPASVAVVLVTVVVLSQLATPATPLFTEEVRSQMLEVSRRSMVFQDLVTRVAASDRVEVSTVTADTTDTIASIREHLGALQEPPPEVAGIMAVLDIALESWSRGVQGVQDDLLAAADGDASLGLPDQLLDAFLDLRAGDRLYRKAVEDLAAADVVQPVSPMPDVQFLPSGYPIAPASVSLIAQARAEGSPLALDSALAIEQVTTVPEWVLDTEDTLVVDATDSLVIRVVVTNAGNAASDPTSLIIEVAGGDGSSQSDTVEVPGLEATEKTTVTFDPLPVTPGRQYSLVVRLALAPGDAQTSDNSRTLRFRVNEGTTSTTG